MTDITPNKIGITSGYSDPDFSDKTKWPDNSPKSTYNETTITKHDYIDVTTYKQVEEEKQKSLDSVIRNTEFAWNIRKRKTNGAFGKSKAKK